jgi:hypothetical protein
MAGKEILDRRFELGGFVVSLGAGAAWAAQIFRHEVDCLIIAVGIIVHLDLSILNSTQCAGLKQTRLDRFADQAVFFCSHVR